MTENPNIHVSREGNVIRIGDGRGGGLYNAIFGRHPGSDLLLGLLQTRHPVEFGRFRDAWVERHGDVLMIRVLTRNGDNNRPDQAKAIDSMRAHPWYDHDADQDFDNTYADFYFRPQLDTRELADTPELLSILDAIAVEPVDQDQRWKDAIAKMETEGPPQAAVEQFEKVFGEMGLLLHGDDQ